MKLDEAIKSLNEDAKTDKEEEILRYFALLSANLQGFASAQPTPKKNNCSQ